MIGYICISVFKKSPMQQLKPWLQQGLPNFCMSRASGYKTADPVLRNLNLWGILVSGKRDMSLCSYRTQGGKCDSRKGFTALHRHE